MTDSEYNRLVELRNKCYRDRRDRETEINYFTGFNDGYEKGKEIFEKENAKAKEYIKLLLMNCVGVYESTGKTIAEIKAEAEQFISEVEK